MPPAVVALMGPSALGPLAAHFVMPLSGPTAADSHHSELLRLQIYFVTGQAASMMLADCWPSVASQKLVCRPEHLPTQQAG